MDAIGVPFLLEEFRYDMSAFGGLIVWSGQGISQVGYGPGEIADCAYLIGGILYHVAGAPRHTPVDRGRCGDCGALGRDAGVTRRAGAGFRPGHGDAVRQGSSGRNDMPLPAIGHGEDGCGRGRNGE